MLLRHEFYAGFIPGKTICDARKQCESISALQLDSREAVDQLLDKVEKAGGNEYREAYDHGFMYGRAFEDVDGHIWEPFWMDPNAGQQ